MLPLCVACLTNRSSLFVMFGTWLCVCTSDRHAFCVLTCEEMLLPLGTQPCIHVCQGTTC